VRERNFAYAVGRIRALETKLLDANQLERIAETASLNDALAKLGETEYSPLLAGLKQSSKFETVLNQELIRVAGLVTELSGKAPEFLIFRHRYDFQNLKVILKTETIQSAQLSNLGVWPPEWLLEKAANNDWADFPEVVRVAVGAAKAAFQASGDGQEVDRILDAAWFSLGYRTMKEGISPLLFQWWLALIDLTNLRTFIRLRIIGMSGSELQKYWIEQGTLSLDDFRELWEQPDEKVALWLANTRFDKLLPDGVQTLNSLSRLEREFDNYLINLIAPAKMISLGIEPLIGYWLAKENEVKILRIILVGKSNQVGNAEIKERLRRAYA